MIPTFLSELVRTVVIMTITGGLLCLLLLAIKPLIRHRLPKSAQYYFWLVVLGALLIPISRFVVLPDAVPNAAPIHNVVERNVVSVAEETTRFYREWGDELRFFTPATSEQPAQMTRYPRDGAEPSLVTGSPPVPSLWVRSSTLFMRVYPWAVALVLIYSLIGYARFARKLRRGYVCPGNHELAMLGELAKGKRAPRLIKSVFAATPMLIGVFRPTIVLPDREYSAEQLHGILLHELTHMRRFDVAVKWFSLFACAVHWFNPLVWIARRQIDRACELACDEAVVRNMDANNKQNYGETLIAVAADKRIPLPVMSTTMCTEKKAIRERLTAIMKTKRHTRSVVLVSVIAVLLITGIFIVLGAGSNSETPATGYTTAYMTASQEQVIRDAVSLHGISEDIRMDGVADAWLIDFNSDGIPELLFTIREYYGSGVRHYVYDGDGVRLFAGVATPFSTGTTSFDIAFTENGTLYLHQSTWHLWARTEYFYTFANGHAEVAMFRHAISHTHDDDTITTEYTVNGNIVDEDYFEKAPQSYLGVVDTAHPAMRFAAVELSQFANELSFMELIRTSGQRVFVLENMTDRERLEQMTSITLYADGAATIANAVISSFLVPGSETTFVVEENELAIYWEGQETAIARFAVIDNDTLEFLFTDVPIRAEVGARYVFTPDWRGIFGDTESDLCDHGGVSVENMIHRASSLNMLAFSTHADDELISNFINTFGFVHEVNAVNWEADWHHTLVFWADAGVRDLSLEIFGETVITIATPSYNEAIVVKVAPMHYLSPCGAFMFTDENGTQHRIYFIQDMGADIVCWCFWAYVLTTHEIAENAHPFAIALADFNAHTTGDTRAFLVDVDGNNTPGMLVIDLYGFTMGPMGTLFYLHNGVIRQADVGGQDAGVVSSMTVSGRRLVNVMGDGGDSSFTLFFINESGALETEFIIYRIGGFGEPNQYYMFTDTPQYFLWDNRYAITHEEFNEFLSRYGLDNLRGPWWSMDDESNIIMNLQNDVSISFLPEGLAGWDTSVAPEPFVTVDAGNYIIHGIGGLWIFNPRQRSFYFHGSNFAGLYGEVVMGYGYLTNNILSIDFAVGRNEMILPYIEGPLGTLAGPGVFFEYEIGLGVIALNNYPFVFDNDSHPPIEFEMTEEGVVQFAHLLLFVYELVNN